MSLEPLMQEFLIWPLTWRLLLSWHPLHQHPSMHVPVIYMHGSCLRLEIRKAAVLPQGSTMGCSSRASNIKKRKWGCNPYPMLFIGPKRNIVRTFLSKAVSFLMADETFTRNLTFYDILKWMMYMYIHKWILRNDTSIIWRIFSYRFLWGREKERRYSSCDSLRKECLTNFLCTFQY